MYKPLRQNLAANVFLGVGFLSGHQQCFFRKKKEYLYQNSTPSIEEEKESGRGDVGDDSGDEVGHPTVLSAPSGISHVEVRCFPGTMASLSPPFSAAYEYRWRRRPELC